MQRRRALAGVLWGAACAALACRKLPRHEVKKLVSEGSPSPAAHPRLEYVHRVVGGSPDEPLPWIIAFHGLGDTPEGFAQIFDNLSLRAHVYLPRAPLAYGSGYDWFGARVADHSQLARGIQARLPDVTELLDTLAASPANVGAAVVTGFSQGGILSFAIAAVNLKHVRSALPIAGWLPPGLVSTPPSMPVVAFHGEADVVVPFTATQALVRSWQAHNRDASLIEFRSYPHVQHTISASMHKDWAAALQKAIAPSTP